MSESKIGKAVAGFWQVHGTLLLSVVLAIYSLPQAFYLVPDVFIEGSWKRAINLAIKNHLIFGTDFVFTYGPLGFLSTRNPFYISGFLLLTGDLFLATGVFYIVHALLKRYSGWFFIALFAMFFFRGGEYAQMLFLVFVIISILGFRSSFLHSFESVYCAVAGSLLFFVKINYGIIAVLVLTGIAVLQAVSNRKALACIVAPLLLVFGFVYYCFNIDLVNYIRYSIPLINNYSDAMTIPVNVTRFAFTAAILCLAVFITIAVRYMVSNLKQLNGKGSRLASVSLLVFTCFLFYKNGFTRADYFHYSLFFSAFPFFVVCTFFVTGFCESRFAKAAAIAVLFLSGTVFFLQQQADGFVDYKHNFSYASPVDYFAGFAEQKHDAIPPEVKIGEDKRQLIGAATIDLMPHRLSYLELNRLNYKPRPVMQSYSVYSPGLDSLNAMHFYKEDRPRFVMIKDDAIDNRYIIWDESITRATMHLNYEFKGVIPINGDSLLTNNQAYVLLGIKQVSSRYPEFKEIEKRVVKFEDTVRLDFAADDVVFMSAEIGYSFPGKLGNIVLQPPVFTVTFLVDGLPFIEKRFVRTALQSPVLINKFIGNTEDLKNFITGDLVLNKSIRGFVLHSTNGAVEPEVRLVFSRFSNY